MGDATVRAIREIARQAHKDFPQYEGHWDGPEWSLAVVLRRVRTKAGVAFVRGELVIAKHDADPLDGHQRAVAYSVNNRIDTVLRTKDIHFFN